MSNKPIRLFRRDQMLDFEKHLVPGYRMKWRTATGNVASAVVRKSGGGDVFIEDHAGKRMQIYVEQVASVETPEATFVLRPIKGRGTL